MKAETSQVFVVDDDVSVREALTNLLRSVGLAVQTFETAEEFLSAKRPPGPGCLILDVRLPGTGGLDLQRRLAESRISIPVIFITGHGDIQMSVRAMKAGAVEFLTKPFRDQELLDAVQNAIEYNRREREARAESADLQSRYDSLSPREQEVFVRVVRGLVNKQIGNELKIAEPTVKLYRGRLMHKMGATSLAELVRMAEKILAPPAK